MIDDSKSGWQGDDDGGAMAGYVGETGCSLLIKVIQGFVSHFSIPVSGFPLTYQS